MNSRLIGARPIDPGIATALLITASGMALTRAAVNGRERARWRRSAMTVEEATSSSKAAEKDLPIRESFSGTSRSSRLASRTMRINPRVPQISSRTRVFWIE